jgi:hypothetical protein
MRLTVSVPLNCLMLSLVGCSYLSAARHPAGGLPNRVNFCSRRARSAGQEGGSDGETSGERARMGAGGQGRRGAVGIGRA